MKKVALLVSLLLTSIVGYAAPSFATTTPKQSYTVFGGAAGAHLNTSNRLATSNESIPRLKQMPSHNVVATPLVSDTLPKQNPAEEVKQIDKSVGQVAQQQILFEQKMQAKLQNLQQQNMILARTVQALYKKVNTLQAASVTHVALTPKKATAKYVTSKVKFSWYLEIVCGVLGLLCFGLLIITMFRRTTNGVS